MRGTQDIAQYAAELLRFIPAHAGNTSSGRTSRPAPSVHPRACGEHSTATEAKAQEVGSSPRMRGTHPRRDVTLLVSRFIPAHAGNTSAWSISPFARAVHPRACGEHWIFTQAYPSSIGSSPRMRGTLQVADGRHPGHRFIPAHAGNTSASAPNGRMSSVHPRACGEHLVRSRRRRDQAGSSPRMRGTLVLTTSLQHMQRFIPAHAGNTEPPFGCGWVLSVHPRACGEHPRSEAPPSPDNGSSPRMRGTRRVGVSTQRASRFIPAHAGNTGARYNGKAVRAVHPRACGEHEAVLVREVDQCGSSPRMRGTHFFHPAEIAAKK